MATSYGGWEATTAEAASAVSAVAEAATAATAAITSIGNMTSSNVVTSALSTIGDAQFFEESISAATVRTQLAVTGDPSNPSTTLNLLRGMKWLLANMSKGRNVSDFFPHVVKLVGSPNLEVRKMVYIYLARYANHDDDCRELALLSINAFQRGLADREPLLRSLALRVLTCMDVPDVLQLQVLGVRTCCKDSSPYVRKCAANAVGKLHPRCTEMGDVGQAEQLVEIITRLLEDDGSTMVLSSAMIAFCEICPHRLELLHGCYRKVCHLLTDMDEWGQVVVMDAFMQYCRRFFKQPRGQMHGSAERIDRERRITRGSRKVNGLIGAGGDGSITKNGGAAMNETLLSLDVPSSISSTTTNGISTAPSLPPRPKQKIKRRVVKKGFYSDEEDESVEEEVDDPYYSIISSGNIARSLRESPVMGSPSGGANKLFFRDDANAPLHGNGEQNGSASAIAIDDDEDGDLDEDHKLLLHSSLPLLKSRNSAVVLAACSLHYHCGIASVKIRTALGKALVRIHRDRREIQYIVLVAIRTLVQECPSAFSPFLDEFFVKGMDPPFTRKIKLDILVSLSTDPKSIDAVLAELRTYVRHSDKAFTCAAIRAVGKVAELARIAYDLRAHTTRDLDAASAREESDFISLNCLSGLVTLSEFSKNMEVVGECAKTMQRILSQLSSDDGIVNTVKDTARIQERVLKRLLIILVRSLNPIKENDDEEQPAEQTQLQLRAVLVPDSAVASIIFIIGDWLTTESMQSLWRVDEQTRSEFRLEVLRLLGKQFTKLDSQIKLQAVHLASKVLLLHKGNQASTTNASNKECAVSEFILAMARIDVMQDVRDRARYEGNVLHMSVGLSYDSSALLQLPQGASSITLEMAKSLFLCRKPNSSSLPLDNKVISGRNTVDPFRFGTLSNVVNTRTAGSNNPLPSWASTNSPSTLRDATVLNKTDNNVDETKMYSSSDEDSSSSDDSSSSSSENESSDSESSDSSVNRNLIQINDMSNAMPTFAQNANSTSPRNNVAFVQNASSIIPSRSNGAAQDESSSDSSSDDSSDSNDDSSDESTQKGNSNGVGNITSSGGQKFGTSGGMILDMNIATTHAPAHYRQTSSSSSVAAGLEDLVMAPLVGSKNDVGKHSSLDEDCGIWKEYVRPSLSGGTLVKMRFVYGTSRVRESLVMGLDPKSPTTVCLQVHIENM